jgi:uncharacterized membrane protein
MTILVRDIQNNPLAAVVLAALIIGEIISLLLMARRTPIPAVRSWHAGGLILGAALGLPAVLDLLRTSGAPLVFAAVVSATLVLTIAMVVLGFTQKPPQPLVAQWYTWAIPVLVASGFIVAGYLTYTEVTATAPTCGVVISGCHVVQASPYSKLFGILPIGIVGLIGYGAVLAGWLLWRWGPAQVRPASSLAIWVVCFFGVMFSAYLTYLELGVIGATCVWCITSAVLMLLLLWVSTPAAQAVFVSEDEAG